MSETLIGKGTWIDKVAANLLNRERKLARKINLIRVESGLGASGIPHIGSMGDAVRAYGIKLALENFGHKAELIAYSDDMDGLRRVPPGLPNWLEDYLLMPVSNIPDPFGECHTSYGAHMSSLLLEGLDNAKIPYHFQSAAQAYNKGMLAKQIDIILRNSHLLGQKIAEYVGQKKYNEILPYFPVCESCGRLYVARAEQYLPDKRQVLYVCAGSRIGQKKITGCGYSGQADITKGDGKLAWKVEFAARWNALDIRFEAYGKDIMDSVRVNDWVADEILHYPHPLHVKYEMFLDKGGKKISKSAGNVLTPQIWLKYGTPESILLLLFKRIIGTRHVGVSDIPVLMDEYDFYEDIYFDRIKENNQAKLTKIKGLYEYINHLKPPSQPSPHISYRMLVQQAALFSSEERIDKVYSRLVKYGMIKENSTDLKKRIKLASNWVSDQLVTQEKFEIEMKENYGKATKELIQTLKSFLGSEQESDAPKNLQSKIFNIARTYEIEPKEFFTLLYRMLLNADRGPRLGNYALDLGIERTCDILETYIS